MEQIKLDRQIKIWIARDGDYAVFESEHCLNDKIHGLKLPGKLHIFYDTPQLTGHAKAGKFIDEQGDPLWRTDYWFYEQARCCCEIPRYMFPEIKGGECYMLTADVDISNFIAIN